LIVSRQEGLDEGIAIGEARGEARGRVETARAMLSDGVPLEKVIKYTGLTDADLKNLK
jgi:predicted transposase/invertase (TIGR01784 family)